MAVTVDNSSELRHEERPRGLGNRGELLSALEEAVCSELSPKVLVIFALDGFREYAESLGRVESDALLAELSARLEHAVSAAGSCYRARLGEFALLCDAGAFPLEPLLDRAVAALSEPDRPVPVSAAFGAVLVPAEATDPIAALRLVDARLTAAQPGRPPRERRRLFPASSRPEDRVGAAMDRPAEAAPLEAIRGELAEASLAARKVRLVDQLLDVAGTLTRLADAARIDDREAGRLHGQPREPARIPLLLKELGLKLAALRALQGPEIAEATGLASDPAPIPPGIGTRVLAALDEIGTALAAA